MALKVLLADDNMTAQNMGRKILAEAGYEVIAVSNGSAALKKFAEHRPDLLVLDVYMPGYSGLEVCEKVKMRAPRSAVLLTVGKMEIYHPEDGRRVRADGLVVKPFEATDLLDAVKKLAENLGAKNGRHAGCAEPHDEGEAPGEARAHSEGAEGDSNVTTSALMTAREAIATRTDVAPVVAVAAAPAEAMAAGGNGAVTSAVAEVIAQEAVPLSTVDASGAALPHEALLAAFSATPVMYLAPPATSETAEQEEQEEDQQWTDEADKAAAMAAAAQASAATIAETSAKGTLETEVPRSEAASEKAEEDEPESYWIAVRVPLSTTSQSAAVSTAAPHVETAVSEEIPSQNTVSEAAADAEPAQEAASSGASLMEQWLHEQARASVETAVPEVVEYPENHAPEVHTTESREVPVPTSDSSAEIVTTVEPASPSALQAVEPAHVDAAAAEAAREVATQSQSDEIAQAVERALERFRETLVEEIARELEKRKR